MNRIPSFILLIFFFSLLLISCDPKSDEEDARAETIASENKEEDIATRLTGVYVGKMREYVGSSSTLYESYQLNITKVSNRRVLITPSSSAHPAFEAHLYVRSTSSNPHLITDRIAEEHAEAIDNFLLQETAFENTIQFDMIPSLMDKSAGVALSSTELKAERDKMYLDFQLLKKVE